MSDPAIIEAAAQALRERGKYPHSYDDVAKAVLAAVTPMIEAAALEWAAKVAEGYPIHAAPEASRNIAAAIRALKQETTLLQVRCDRSKI